MKKYLVRELILPVIALVFCGLQIARALDWPHAPLFFLLFSAVPAAAGFIYGRRIGGEQ